MTEPTEPEELTAVLEGYADSGGRVVRAGDVLVLSAPQDTSMEEAARVREGIEHRFPDLAAVVVLAGMRFEFVYRDEEATDGKQ
jgi:hypothetical protein